MSIVRTPVYVAALLLTIPALGDQVALVHQGQRNWPTQPVPLPLVHTLFSSDMVLQRDTAAPIWGWSAPGDTICVAVDGKRSGPPAVAGSDGRWMTRIGPLPAGGPHTVTVEGPTKKETFSNVLFGDVWLCSGQSNMNWPVRLSLNGEEEVKQANYPQIRSFNVAFLPATVPMKLPVPACWQVCRPEYARDFTGAGYFFAREIHKTQKIPVGIIHSSAGATAAEAWVSGDALHEHMPYDFRERLAAVEAKAAEGGADFDYFRAVEKWPALIDPASANKKYNSALDLVTDDWMDFDMGIPGAKVSLADFSGLAWIRVEIDVPPSWAGKDVLLHLQGIHDCDITWWNGALVGAKQVSGDPRDYVVCGGLVKAGKNLLVLAVLRKPRPGGLQFDSRSNFIRPAGEPGAKPLYLGGAWKVKPAVPMDNIRTDFPRPKVGDYKTITAMYNGMIAPLVPYGIKGALWYQGEANGPFWLQYRRLLPSLIADWRSRFQVGDFPFLIVSLANMGAQQTKPVEPGWAEIRESQWRTVRLVPNTGLAMTIDIGDPGDIHPRNKQEVGRRLALVARHLAYGEKNLVCSGPEFTEMMIELPKGDKIRLYFKHVGGGLMIRPGDKKLTGFAVAGFDRKWVWADAVIEGNTIVVSSPECPEPKYVRYGWAFNPVVNLYNKEGLPAVTFRTDE